MTNESPQETRTSVEQNPPNALVVPLLSDSSPAPSSDAAVPPQMPKGMKAWYVLRGTTVLGILFLGLGTAGFVVYLTTDKEHLKDHVFLGVSIGLIAFGAHLVSRQSVKNFLADFGRFIPWGKKNGTAEPPTDWQ